MVDSVTNQYEFLAVPREKKRLLFFFFEFIIPFLLDRTEIMFKSNQLSKLPSNPTGWKGVFDLFPKLA